MRGRIGLLAAASVVLLSLTPAPASAADAPVTALSCGSGWVQTSAPYVLARQGARGATGPDAFWIARLWGHNGTSWVPMQWSRYWSSPVQTSDFSLGGTIGYAGPTWYTYGVENGSFVSSTWFSVASGYWYAIENWVHDGTWSRSFAGANIGYSCRA